MDGVATSAPSLRRASVLYGTLGFSSPFRRSTTGRIAAPTVAGLIEVSKATFPNAPLLALSRVRLSSAVPHDELVSHLRTMGSETAAFDLLSVRVESCPEEF